MNSPKVHVMSVFAGAALLGSGCFVGTPKEQIEKFGGRIDVIRPGEVTLDLGGCRVGDAEMHAVSALCSNHPEYESIRVLDLSHTRVSDKGLEILAELDTLEELNLSNTRVTKAGIAEFMTTVPACRVVHN